MGILYKITAILSSAVLLITGISIENFNSFSVSKSRNPRHETIRSYFSIEKPNLFIINRNGEDLVTSFKKLPSLKSWSHINDLIGRRIFSEIRKLSFKYLVYSVFVNRNFTVSEIVFPFQYFW
jgi:hypothetical protein